MSQNLTDLENTIETAFENRDAISPTTTGEVRDAIESALEILDNGTARVAVRNDDGSWHVNQWLKKAVLLGFRIKDMEEQEGGPQGSTWWDKVDSKFKGWGENRWKAAGFRAVPNAIVRRSAFIAPNVVLMPSFVNLGAYVDEGTMVDTWATVGSCGQIGENVHLSGGVGIGGVLEPLQATPTIIEDNCFIGSRSIIVEGVRVGKEAVLGANVVLTKSTHIIDVTEDTPVTHRGVVPPRSVVIPGTYTKNFPAGDYQVACALIIGQRKESTDKKTSLNDALRDHSVAVQ